MVKLEQNPNNCTIALTQTDDIFENMIRYTTRSMCSILNSYPIFSVEGDIRKKITSILDENKVYTYFL